MSANGGQFEWLGGGERLGDGTSPAAYARGVAAGAGVDLSGGRILLLLRYPRLLGYAFNPLSVYYCMRADGAPALVIYEVRNTFGGQHCYVCPLRPHDVTEAGIRHATSASMSRRSSGWACATGFT